MRDDIVWPRFPTEAEGDKAGMCEAEITLIYADWCSFVTAQIEENRLLRERIDRLERSQPPKSWLRAVADAVRAEQRRYNIRFSR